MSRETLDDDAITRVDNDGPPPETTTTQVVGATISVLHGSESGRLHFVDEHGVVMGRADEADLVFADATISRAHARLDLQNGHFYLRDLESMNGTFVDDDRLWGVKRLPSSCRVRLGRRTVFQFTAVDQLGADSFLQLRHALFIDPLTGTGNRSFLEQRLREELSFGWRHHEPVAVLLIDLDHFKNVNDQFGHVSGDRVLGDVGAILKETVRTEDSVYRYGGEEFCVLVRGESERGLRAMAERIRVAVERYSLRTDRGEARITVSIGIATLDRREEEFEQTISMGAETTNEIVALSEELIVEHADMALYRAKESGRNQVVMYGD